MEEFTFWNLEEECGWRFWVGWEPAQTEPVQWRGGLKIELCKQQETGQELACKEDWDREQESRRKREQKPVVEGVSGGN
jgi:hypothetical protein